MYPNLYVVSALDTSLYPVAFRRNLTRFGSTSVGPGGAELHGRVLIMIVATAAPPVTPTNANEAPLSTLSVLTAPGGVCDYVTKLNGTLGFLAAAGV